MPDAKLSSLLSEFGDAVSAENRSRAKELVDDIGEILDRENERETALLAAAVEARDTQNLSSDDFEALDSFARDAAAIKLARGAFLTQASTYVVAPSQVDVESLQDSTATLQDEEETLEQRASSAESALESVSLPPVLTASADAPDTHPKGATFDVVGTLRNVGDTAASEVTVSLEGDLPVSPASVSESSLSGGDALETTFTVDADTEGEFDLLLGYAADNAEDGSTTISVTVLAKLGAIRRAKSELERVEQSLEEADFDRQTRQSLDSKLDAAGRKLDDAADFADAGRGKQADNQLDAAANVLGAALNQLHAGSGGESDGGNGNGKNAGKGTGRGDDDSTGDGRDVSTTETGRNLIIGAIETVLDRIATARKAEL